MGRPRCDPFDAAAILAAIVCGETTALRAYREYASTAARPYARSTWEMMLKKSKAGRREPSFFVFPPPLQKTAWGSPRRAQGRLSGRCGKPPPVKPSNVLTLTGDSVSLSVKRGALIAAKDATPLVYEPRAVKLWTAV